MQMFMWCVHAGVCLWRSDVITLWTSQSFSTIYVSVYLSMYLSMYLSFYVSMYLFTSLCIYVSICDGVSQSTGSSQFWLDWVAHKFQLLPSASTTLGWHYALLLCVCWGLNQVLKCVQPEIYALRSLPCPSYWQFLYFIHIVQLNNVL